MTLTSTFLADLSSAIEHILDRDGNLSDDQVVDVLDPIRYTDSRDLDLDYIDFVVNDRLVRVTAKDIGPYFTERTEPVALNPSIDTQTILTELESLVKTTALSFGHIIKMLNDPNEDRK